MWWALKAFLLKPAIIAIIVAIVSIFGGVWLGGISKDKVKDELSEVLVLNDELTIELVRSESLSQKLQEQIDLVIDDRDKAQRLASRHQRINAKIQKQSREILLRLKEINEKHSDWATTPPPDDYRRLRESARETQMDIGEKPAGDVVEPVSIEVE
jgi:ATP-dependent Lon protease